MSENKINLPTILLTSFFTALFLLLLFAGGVYWFINHRATNDFPAEPPKDHQTKPTPRVKKPSSIAASEITRVEFSELTSRSNSTAALVFGNVNPNNHVTRSTTISFNSDGRAEKQTSQNTVANGERTPALETQTGTIPVEKFTELAQVLIENDFPGEEDSKTSTSLPIQYTLTIIYSSKVKKIQTSNSGKDTPEAEAMLRAFKRLENSISWKKQ